MLGDMIGQLSKELFWLTMTCVLTGLIWLPYTLDRLKVRGFWATMDNPSPRDKPQSPWAQRLYFAHTNAVDNLVCFAALVLVLAELERATTATAIACAVYFWSRLAQALVYTLGIPVLRTVTFTIGFLAQAVLALAIFKLL